MKEAGQREREDERIGRIHLSIVAPSTLSYFSDSSSFEIEHQDEGSSLAEHLFAIPKDVFSIPLTV